MVFIIICNYIYLKKYNGLQKDKTVIIKNSNIEEIQKIIDSQEKNLNGHTLTFQFEESIINLVNIKDFYKGTIKIEREMKNDDTNKDK